MSMLHIRIANIAKTRLARTCAPSCALGVGAFTNDGRITHWRSSTSSSTYFNYEATGGLTLEAPVVDELGEIKRLERQRRAHRLAAKQAVGTVVGKPENGETAHADAPVDIAMKNANTLAHIKAVKNGETDSSPFAYGVKKPTLDPYDFPHSYVSPTDFTFAGYKYSDNAANKTYVYANKSTQQTSEGAVVDGSGANTTDVSVSSLAKLTTPLTTTTTTTIANDDTSAPEIAGESGSYRSDAAAKSKKGVKLPRKLQKILSEPAPQTANNSIQPKITTQQTPKSSDTVPETAKDKVCVGTGGASVDAAAASVQPVANNTPTPTVSTLSTTPTVSTLSTTPSTTTPTSTVSTTSSTEVKHSIKARWAGLPYTPQQCGLPPAAHRLMATLHSKNPQTAIKMAAALIRGAPLHNNNTNKEGAEGGALHDNRAALLRRCKDADITQLCTSLAVSATKMDAAATKMDVAPTVEWAKACKRDPDSVRTVSDAVEQYWATRLSEKATTSGGEKISAQGTVSLRHLVWMLNALHRLGGAASKVEPLLAAALANMGHRAWRPADIASMTHLFSLRDKRHRELYAPIFAKVAKSLMDSESAIQALDDVCLAGLLHASDCQFHAGGTERGLSKSDSAKLAGIIAGELLKRLRAQSSLGLGAACENAEWVAEQQQRFPGVPFYGHGTLLSHPDGCMALGLLVLCAQRMPGLPNKAVTEAAADAIAAVGATQVSTRTITSLFTSFTHSGSTPSLGFLEAVYKKFMDEDPLLGAAVDRFMASTKPGDVGEAGVTALEHEGAVLAEGDAETAVLGEDTLDLPTKTKWLPVKIALLHLRSIPDMIWASNSFTVSYPPLLDLLCNQLKLAVDVAHEVALRQSDSRPRMMQSISPAISTSTELPEAVSLGACVATFAVLGKQKPKAASDIMQDCLPYIRYQLGEMKREIIDAARTEGVELNFEGQLDASASSADERVVESDSEGSSDDISVAKPAAPAKRSVNLLPPWVRTASDLCHAYSHILSDLTKIGADGVGVQEVYDEAASVVPGILRAYHSSGQAWKDAEVFALLASNRTPDASRSVFDSLAMRSMSGSGVDPTKARLRDGFVKRSHYRYFPLDASDDVSRYGLQATPPFPLSVCTGIAASFASRGYPAHDLMQALGIHVTHMLGVKPIRPMLSPSHLARFLHSVARAREPHPTLFKAAGKFMRWLLQTPALAASLPPIFFITFLRSCQLSRYRMPTTITSMCDHLSGVHFVAEGAGSVATPWSDSHLPAVTDGVTSCDERLSAAKSHLAANAASVHPKRRVCRRDGGISKFTVVELQDLMSLLHLLEIRHPPLEEQIWRRIGPSD